MAPSQSYSKEKETIHVEDKVLYMTIGGIVLFVLIMFFGVLFLIRPYEVSLDYPVGESEAEPFWVLHDGEDILVSHLKAQTANTILRYNHAASVQLSHNIWRTLGYLVGSIVALLGCMIAVRGVRVPIEADIAVEQAKAKIATSSVGAFIVLLGTIILVSTVLDQDQNPVADDGIILPSAYPARLLANEAQIRTYLAELEATAADEHTDSTVLTPVANEDDTENGSTNDRADTARSLQATREAEAQNSALGATATVTSTLIPDPNNGH